MAILNSRETRKAGWGSTVNTHLRRYSTVLTIVFFSLLTMSMLLSAQAKKPLTSADLIQMKTAGFDDQTIINAIGANDVSLDTSVQGLMTLKKAGLSEKVIDAALAAAAPKPASGNSSADESGLPEDIGAYAMVKNALTPLPVEVVNFKTAGTLGMAFSYGIKKAKFEGVLPGQESSMRLTDPVTFVLRCADGTAPTEYQLIRLDTKKDSREFTQSKMGLTGASGGVDRQALSVNFQRIGRDTYKGTLPDLKSGEYGFLAPGTVVSPLGASTGKLYTFGVSE